MRTIRVNKMAYKELLCVTAPALWVLYTAGWSAGYTVNGVRP